MVKSMGVGCEMHVLCTWYVLLLKLNLVVLIVVGVWGECCEELL